MDYIFYKYIEPVSIKDKISYIKISKASKHHICELAKIYGTLFNSDNRNVLDKLNIFGRTKKEGLWDEKPYTLEICKRIIKEYASSNYFGVVAISKNDKKDIVIGASVYQAINYEKLKEKGIEIPFNIKEDEVEYWVEIDTFRREANLLGTKISYLSNEMRNRALNLFKKEKPVLIYSSTNNPVMVKAWEKDGFTIVKKKTNFGNKYQAFKLVERI